MGSVVNNPPANVKTGSVSGLGRSPGDGNGNPLQYSCLRNLLDRTTGCSSWGHKESDMTEYTHKKKPKQNTTKLS